VEMILYIKIPTLLASAGQKRVGL